MPDTNPQLDPSPILQTAFAFWSSKVLLPLSSSVCSPGSAIGAELGGELGLHPRGIGDFFDALVAMKFLDRDCPGSNSSWAR